MALSPFEVLNTPTQEVYDLYVDAIIHDHKQKKTNGTKTQQQDEWITSKNATWH